MKLSKVGFGRGLVWGLCALGCLSVSCKDDDPCDPGQVVMNTQCYPAAAAGGSSSTDDGGTEAGASSESSAGASATPSTAFGDACMDKVGSSDCGGVAPVCADLTPLGQSVMCTQINCGAGEANAGVCPSTFTCFAPPGYPSVCIKK